MVYKVFTSHENSKIRKSQETPDSRLCDLSALQSSRPWKVPNCLFVFTNHYSDQAQSWRTQSQNQLFPPSRWDRPFGASPLCLSPWESFRSPSPPTPGRESSLSGDPEVDGRIRHLSGPTGPSDTQRIFQQLGHQLEGFERELKSKEGLCPEHPNWGPEWHCHFKLPFCRKIPCRLPSLCWQDRFLLSHRIAIFYQTICITRDHHNMTHERMIRAGKLELTPGDLLPRIHQETGWGFDRSAQTDFQPFYVRRSVPRFLWIYERFL